jgi:CRISPR-associated protein Cas1
MIKITLNVKIPPKSGKKILSISYAEWQKMGFSKGTLHYLKKNSKSEKPFTFHKKVRERLEHWHI